jgi:phosphoribosylformylglycinamidine synthase
VKIGIVIFPGSNCDYDAYQAFKMVDGVEVEYLWHGSDDLKASDIVVLPGGFSYGDYLRGGSIARFSPIMKKVIEFAGHGGRVLGICNGFQILLESGLLPGALMKNANLRFACREVVLRVENPDSVFTSGLRRGQLLRMPVAHGEGNYFADPATLTDLESEGRVVFRYVDSRGVVTARANPNGSINGIAGIINENGNILGMMPHPERAMELILGSDDGFGVIKSFCAAKA